MLDKGYSLEDDYSANFFFITKEDLRLPKELYGRFGECLSFVL